MSSGTIPFPAEQTPLETDLGRWEAGELSSDELGFLHPEADVRGYIETWDTMRTASLQAVPDPAASWDALRDRLGAQPVPLRQRRIVHRLAVVASVAASITALTAIAGFAGPKPVRDAVRSFADTVVTGFTQVFVGNPATPLPTERPRIVIPDMPRIDTPQAPAVPSLQDPVATPPVQQQPPPAVTFAPPPQGYPTPPAWPTPGPYPTPPAWPTPGPRNTPQPSPEPTAQPQESAEPRQEAGPQEAAEPSPQPE